MSALALLLALALPGALCAAEGPLGAELFRLGVPPSIPVHVLVPADEEAAEAEDYEGSVRQEILKLYDPRGGEPTPMGRRLHGLLARLTDAELARVDRDQLAEALRLLRGIDRAAADVKLPAEEFERLYPRAVEPYLLGALRVLRARPAGPALGLKRGGPDVRTVLAERRARYEASREAIRDLSERRLPALLGDGWAGRLARSAFDALTRREAAELQEAVAAVDALTGRAREEEPLTHLALLRLVQTLPKGSLTDAQWDALIRAFPMGHSLSSLGVADAWRAGIDGRGVTIGIVDDGADEEHADLAGSVAPVRAFTREVRRFGDRKGEPETRGDHGTWTAGIAHAVAPRARIRPYRVWDYEEDVPEPLRLSEGDQQRLEARAMRAALADGCDVVSCSGGYTEGNLHLNETRELNRAIEELVEGGVPVFYAASNEGPGTTTVPGNSPAPITVGMVDFMDLPDLRSSSKYLLDNTQPRPVPARALPDCFAYGVDVCAASFDPKRRLDPAAEAAADGGFYEGGDGTSASAPMAAGVAALLKQRARRLGRELTVEETRRLLRGTAAPIRLGSGRYPGTHGTGVIRAAPALDALLTR